MQRHDHVRNGIAPVKGCAICDLIVLAAKNNDEKEPEGRQPPWLWDDGRDDK
jgi:hypothetical protein